MTVKQQKMGLLSSSTEESTLAVSPPELYQITSNAPLWLAAVWSAICIINHALVLVDLAFKWIKVVFFFPSLLLFPSSLSSIVKWSQASLC